MLLVSSLLCASLTFGEDPPPGKGAGPGSNRQSRRSSRTAQLRAGEFPLPGLISPDSGATGVSIHPRATWSGVPGALYYIVQISTDTSFAGLLPYQSIVSDTVVWVDTALANATHYFWRVGAADRDSLALFGPPSEFTTGLSPSSQPIHIPDSRKNTVTVACATVHNRGALPITIDSLSRHPRLVAGTIFPTVIAAGESAVMQYNYHPRAFGDVRDTMVLFTDEGECRVPFFARCSPPVIRAAQSEATLGPVAVDDSAASSLVFVNDGPLNSLTVSKVWTRTQFFSVSFLPLRVIESGESLRVPVRFHIRGFRPDAFGSYVDTCSVESDGGRCKVVLHGESPSPRLVLEPPMLSFGDVAARDTVFAVLRVINSSVNTLRIDSVRNRNRVFRPTVSRVRVGGADTVSLTFRYTPATFGTHIDTVVLYNNSWRGPVRVPAVGVSPYPVLEAGVDRVDFGGVGRGDTSGVLVRIANGSISALRIESVRTRTRIFRLTQPALPASVHKGDTLRIPLHFYPDSIRHFSDTLVIVSNAVGSPHRIPLRGDGVPPGVSAGRSGLPGEIELYQNFPNPFRRSTTFRFALPEPSHVRLEVFTTLGQQIAVVVDGEKPAGYHDVAWDSDATSGVYYYRLIAEPQRDAGKRYTATRKMVLMR